MFVAVLVSLSFMSAIGRTEPVPGSTYVATVYKHNLIQNPNPRVSVSRSAALQHMQKNLDVFEEQAAQQVCALVRCAGSEASSCGKEVSEAETKMDFLLEGKSGTRYVYPSVLASHMVLEQPEYLEKTADGTVTMKHSNMTGGLVTACLYGRMYHLDNE
ncbi:biotinidase-like protein [Lates japonicus]|uniref:Biotinidase-like protein n=1 Tax=Lates japonicus TaxID=270547 RepID=A0AAD3MXR0_LATJO|nr:biotinidase-like protein [Lates japonicus]